MRRRLHQSVRGLDDLLPLVGMIAHAELQMFRNITRALDRGLLTGEVTDEEVVEAIKNCPDHFASTFAGTLSDKLQITETMIAADVPNVATADAAVQFSIGTVEAISGVTAIASMSKALSAGAGTIDLTALTHRGVAVDFSGKTVKYLAWNNPSANLITVVEGAANGNALLGASFNISVKPADTHVFKLAASQVVAGADKTIDLTGTASQTLSLLLAAG